MQTIFVKERRAINGRIKNQILTLKVYVSPNVDVFDLNFKNSYPKLTVNEENKAVYSLFNPTRNT